MGDLRAGIATEMAQLPCVRHKRYCFVPEKDSREMGGWGQGAGLRNKRKGGKQRQGSG